jgi:ribonuclease BN (tRNA processing enzyme)
VTVTLTVLGCAGTHGGPGRMCSAYLLESDGYRLLLDCGNGSLSNLQQVCGVDDIDAIIISHLHPDHFADLYGLHYALRFHADGPLSVPVYAPRGAFELTGRLLDDTTTYGQTLRFSVAKAGDELELGPMSVALHAANHPVETLASRIEVGGRVLTYTADSGTAPTLVDAARDADLLLADSTWLERERPLPSGVHMTGLEAGRLAAEAAVKRLLVTHVYPSNDPADVAAEAASAYDGVVDAAFDLQEIML